MAYEDVAGLPCHNLRCPFCGSAAPAMEKQKEHRQWKCCKCQNRWYVENVDNAEKDLARTNEIKNNLSQKPRRKNTDRPALDPLNAAKAVSDLEKESDENSPEEG